MAVSICQRFLSVYAAEVVVGNDPFTGWPKARHMLKGQFYDDFKPQLSGEPTAMSLGRKRRWVDMERLNCRISPSDQYLIPKIDSKQTICLQ